MNLYEISTEYQGAFNAMQDMELDAETIEDSLAAIKGEFEDKAIACVKWEKGIEGKIATIDGEIKRLQSMKKTVTNQRDSFREYIRSSMEATGIDSIESPLFKITLRKATEVVEVDMDKLGFMWTKEVVTADKVKIKAALKSGEIIEGASLVDGKRGLLIK